jgi:CspA family cold shock protein
MAEFSGVVRWFNNAKGYGFLGRDGADDVFVHYSSIQQDGYKSLKEGYAVEFDVITGAQGLQADNVTRTVKADQK